MQALGKDIEDGSALYIVSIATEGDHDVFYIPESKMNPLLVEMVGTVRGHKLDFTYGGDGFESIFENVTSKKEFNAIIGDGEEKAEEDAVSHLLEWCDKLDKELTITPTAPFKVAGTFVIRME